MSEEKHQGEDTSEGGAREEGKPGKEKGDRGPWSEMIGAEVVIDTATRFVYIGTLVERSGGSLVLEEADVHDSRESKSTKEVYIMESAKHGVRVNRSKVIVPERRVMSISRLEDAVIY